MKRILCVILAVLLLTPAVFASGDNMKLTISQPEGEIGDTVTIVGEVKGAPACTSYRVIMTYDDTCLKITGGKSGDTVKGGQINVETSFGDKKAISALAVDVSKSFEGDTVLFTLTGEIIGKPASGNSSPLTIAHYEFFDANVKRITLDDAAVIDGSIVYPSLSQIPDDNTGSTTPDDNTGTTVPDDSTGSTTPDDNTGSEDNITGGNTSADGNTSEDGTGDNSTAGNDDPVKEEEKKESDSSLIYFAEVKSGKI